MERCVSRGSRSARGAVNCELGRTSVAHARKVIGTEREQTRAQLALPWLLGGGGGAAQAALRGGVAEVVGAVAQSGGFVWPGTRLLAVPIWLSIVWVRSKPRLLHTTSHLLPVRPHYTTASPLHGHAVSKQRPTARGRCVPLPPIPCSIASLPTSTPPHSIPAAPRISPADEADDRATTLLSAYYWSCSSPCLSNMLPPS
jgi:hypothetical protein